MKKIGILLTMFLLAIGVASAVPLVVDKDVLVTGDWKWEDGHWNYGDFPTASYSFDASSPLATAATYYEAENLGTPWKYSLDMMLTANAAGATQNTFAALTVNDPATTPATGGYTQYAFKSVNQAEFSSTTLTIVGEGQVAVIASAMFDTAFASTNLVRVNE